MNTLHNPQAERTVLGCILLNSDSLGHVQSVLEVQDFGLDAHRQIYLAITELAEAGEPVDDLTVIQALTENGRLKIIGGEAYVIGLSDNVTSELARVEHVEHYAKVVLQVSQRRQLAAAAEVLASATQDPGVTTVECLRQAQESLLRIEATSAKAGAHRLEKIMPEVVRDLKTQAGCGSLVGMPTGLPSLDHMTGGIRPCELWTIGALPGKGKTALGVQIICANGRAGTPTLVFSLEMQELEIGKRLLAAESSLSANQIRNPQTIKPDRWRGIDNAAAAIAQWPVWIDGRSSLKIHELLATARLFIRRHRVKLIIVDYVRLVDAPGREVREQVGYVVNALRRLAKDESVAVVLLSQLRRLSGTNAKPTMSDLKETGDIEAHSHIVLLPHLPVGDDGMLIREEEVLIIGKNRNGGVGDLPVVFDEKRLQFLERTMSELDESCPEAQHSAGAYW